MTDRTAALPGFYTENIQQLPPDPLFGLKARYTADARENKVDLGIGAYRDNSGKPWILPSVKLAENLIQNSASYNHEYLPITGLPEFTLAASKVILGEENSVNLLNSNRLVSVQSLSGTGALHIVARFISDHYKPIGSSSSSASTYSPLIYVSDPTWANHFQIFNVLNLETVKYPYWNTETKSLKLDGFLKSINDAPKGSIFLLHATAHNPTGLDPKPEEWKKILKALSDNNHLPLFDSAYQGFSSGSLDKDAWAVREAITNPEYKFPSILICQSFAKNVGMYGERTGAVHIILPESNIKLVNSIKSQLAKITRSEISNPPAYGAKIVSKILTTPELYKQWEQDLITMSSRIKSMRCQLVEELKNLKTPGDWSHIVEQQGMFSFTGLSPEQVKNLEEKHAIYLLGSGRASIAGLNPNNVKYVAQSIDNVVRNT